MKKVLGWLAFIVFCVTVYFASREYLSLFFIIPLSLLVASQMDKLGGVVASIGVIIICGASLAWVNSKTPIFGDEYDQKVQNERIIKAYKEDLNQRVKDTFNSTRN